jgi:ribosomal protein S18 acetylase RimI-like enzyme
MLCAPERLQFHSYRDCPRDIFHRVLMRTYEQTCDFPEMNGRRTLDDILAGLQAAGYDASRWWLATDWSGAVGVLALNEVEPDVLEVAYVGVAPEARRKGRGRELVRKALFEAKAAGAHELILSVDARNEPALQLYQALGFDEYDRRAVYLLLE